jgi:hypothetical protein
MTNINLLNSLLAHLGDKEVTTESLINIPLWLSLIWGIWEFPRLFVTRTIWLLDHTRT